MRVISWLRSLTQSQHTVSLAWLDAHAAESTKVGWEGGPRWRSPREREEMNAPKESR